VRLLIAHGSSAARAAIGKAVRPDRDAPYEIIEAGEGADALDLLLQDDPPEVALVDWDLPGIEGPEMCRLVRDFHHGHDTHLVILASSGHTDTADAWRAGAAKCISTPASAAALRDCVEEGLRKMRTPQEREPQARARLEAVCIPEGSDGAFYGFGSPEVRETAGLRLVAQSDPEADTDVGFEVEGAEAEDAGPRGPALLQAVLAER
jgi:DNA-binding response OmpR family regulator